MHAYIRTYVHMYIYNIAYHVLGGGAKESVIVVMGHVYPCAR